MFAHDQGCVKVDMVSRAEAETRTLALVWPKTIGLVSLPLEVVILVDISWWWWCCSVRVTCVDCLSAACFSTYCTEQSYSSSCCSRSWFLNQASYSRRFSASRTVAVNRD
jgi:hypothetical protein